MQRRRAERELAQGGDPGLALRTGLGCIAKALAIHPDEPEALALRGTLTALGGRDLTQAAADLQKALVLNPLLQREYGTILDQAKKQLASAL